MLGRAFPDQIIGIHLNAAGGAVGNAAEATEEERNWQRASASYRTAETDYFNEQQHKPGTVSFALYDNPLGSAAWIAEKFRVWTDSGTAVDPVVSKDQILTNVMIYLVTDTMATGVWSYRGSADDQSLTMKPGRVTVPTGFASFPSEMPLLNPPRSVLERGFNLVHTPRCPTAGTSRVSNSRSFSWMMFAPFSGSSERRRRAGGPLLAWLAVSAIVCSLALRAGQGPPSDVTALQMIVASSAEEAEQLRGQIKAGADFAALAREKSVDPTGRDGGHLGRLSVASLRPELRDALQGTKPGQTTAVVRIPTGFAILRVTPDSEAPAPVDSTPSRTLAASATGATRDALPVSGSSKQITVFQSAAKPEGWAEDLQQICRIRTDSTSAMLQRLEGHPRAVRQRHRQLARDAGGSVSGEVRARAAPRVRRQHRQSGRLVARGAEDGGRRDPRRARDDDRDARPRAPAQVGDGQRRLSHAGRLLPVSAARTAKPFTNTAGASRRSDILLDSTWRRSRTTSRCDGC